MKAKTLCEKARRLQRIARRKSKPKVDCSVRLADYPTKEDREATAMNRAAREHTRIMLKATEAGLRRGGWLK